MILVTFIKCDRVTFWFVQELMGRIIRVEFAKENKKPSPPPTLPGEKRYKLYVSNLSKSFESF